jgi:transcription elongation factor Elf1
MRAPRRSARVRSLLNEHERTLECTRCHQLILVCGMVQHLNPDTFVGGSCGCRQPIEPHAVELRAAIDRARAAQTGDGIPYQPTLG